jgi:MerR family transcriptional regulator, mercuric resistance operon regulatory protein
MNKKQSSLTIGRLAKAASVNIETIRHYQRQGLINEPQKPLTGFRQYSIEIIDRIRFIKRAQHLGFSLKEIKDLLLLGDKHCSDVRSLAEEKRDNIHAQVEGLLTVQSALDELIEACKTDTNSKQCALIETLSKKGFLKD